MKKYTLMATTMINTVINGQSLRLRAGDLYNPETSIAEAILSPNNGLVNSFRLISVEGEEEADPELEQLASRGKEILSSLDQVKPVTVVDDTEVVMTPEQKDIQLSERLNSRQAANASEAYATETLNETLNVEYNTAETEGEGQAEAAEAAEAAESEAVEDAEVEAEAVVETPKPRGRRKSTK